MPRGITARAALEVAEDDDFAVSARQPDKLLVKGRGRILQCVINDCIPGFRLEPGRILLAEAATDAVGSNPGRDTSGDPEQPTPNRVPRSDRSSPAEEDEEHSLECVVNVMRVIQSRPTDSQDHRTVAGNQDFERNLVMLSDESFQEWAVAELAHRPSPEQSL